MIKKIAFGAAGLAVAASTVFAASHIDPAIAGAIKARQGLMQMQQLNAGILFGMAQDKVAYDAAAASTAASNLMILTTIDQSALWPQGSDADSLEGTRALPAIWTDYPDIVSKAEALNEAAVAMNAAAGTDLESLKAAIGPIGEACTACHKAYRQPQ